MKKRMKYLLGLVVCVGIIFSGCGKDEKVQTPVVDNLEDKAPEVTIIDDNGGEVVNELLEEEKDPIAAELMEDPEEEKEQETVIPSATEEEEKKVEKPIIDPVTEAEIEEDDIVADVNNLNGHQENMLILMDSLNMLMAERDNTYDAADVEFFWNAINYTIANYPEVPGSDSEDMLVWAEDYSSIKVHKDLIDVYAEGLFAAYKELPEVPADSMVTVSEEEGYYNLSVGDRGDSYGEIVTWVETAEGNCHVEARLVNAATEETIVSYVYELVENTSENAVFAYRIKSVKIKE